MKKVILMFSLALLIVFTGCFNENKQTEELTLKQNLSNLLTEMSAMNVEGRKAVVNGVAEGVYVAGDPLQFYSIDVVSAMTDDQKNDLLNAMLVDPDNSYISVSARAIMASEFGVTYADAADIIANAPDANTLLDGDTAIVNMDVDGNAGDQGTVGDPDTPPAGDALAVTDVTATNRTTIVVTFNKAVDAVAVANFTVSVGATDMTIDSAGLSEDKTQAILTVQGLAFGDVATVMITGVMAGAETVADTTDTATVPALGDLYALEITCDDADATIKSDGATKTMLTATLKQKSDDSVVVVDGLVDFATTRGGLAQTQVAFENGSASVQLTSESSPSTVVAYITAIINEAPDASEYEGLTGQFEVTFSPDEVDPNQTEFVTLVSAESNQGDIVSVTFSDAISASAYKAQLVSDAGADDWAALVTAGTSAGLQLDGANIVVSDIVQSSDNVLNFILDTDNDGQADKSAVPATERIQAGWGGPATKNYLRDNANHTITVPNNIGSLVLADATGAQFIMTDAAKPSIYGVTSDNQVTFYVRCSESMAEDLVEGARGAVNDKFLIDGDEVWLTAAAAGATAGEEAAADANDYVLVNDLYVGSYDAGSGVNNRKYIYFELDNYSKLGAGTHIIQIAEIGDWAAMVDTNNMVSTQTFDFTVPVDNSKPTVTLTLQSPEQWRLDFSERIYFEGTESAAIEVYIADDNTALRNDEGYVTGTDDVLADVPNFEYAITEIQQDPTVLLIEFNKDWTEYYTTSTQNDNYWNTAKNPHKVKIIADQIKDGLDNYADAVDLTVTIPMDATSPSIVSAVDVNTIDSNVAAGQFVRVTMDEPVQVEDETGAPSTMRMTPSEQQTDDGNNTPNDTVNVPQPTFEFVKGDTTVQGQINDGSILDEDYVFDVEPDSTLSAGDWSLIIRNLTDDVGNAYNTTAYTVTVPGTPDTVTDTKLAWAAFDNSPAVTDAGNNDYIYIKFTKVMDPAGAAGVSRTTNYVFNGVELPEGSQVYKGIDGVTDDWDGVTIEMPATDFLVGVNGLDGSANGGEGTTDATSVLNVANNFKAADGEDLSSPYEVELTDMALTENPDSDADGDMIFEAVYDGGLGTILGQPIVAVAGQDTDTNGAIDTLVLTLGGNVDASALIANANGDEVLEGSDTAGVGSEIEFLVNGNTWRVAEDGVDDDDDTILLVATATDALVTPVIDANLEISGTVTSGISVTETNGSLVIEAGQVVDEAAPIITSAVLSDTDNDGDAEVTLTFGEAIDDSTVTVANFTFNAQAAASFDTGATADDAIIVLDTFGGAVGTGAADIVYTAGTLDDLATVPNAVGTHTFLAANVTDNAAPILIAVVNSAATFNADDVLTFTFSEAINPASDEDALANFTETTAGAGSLKVDPAAADNAVATVAIDDATWANGDSILLTVANIVDAEGNTLNTAGDNVTFTDVTGANVAGNNTIN